MIQRFIELGEGYADIFEWLALVEANSHRVKYILRLDTEINSRNVSSIAAVFTPSGENHFQPVYICREGLLNPEHKSTQRFDMVYKAASSLNKNIIPLSVKPSSMFPEKGLYYQYLIGILRMNKYLTPLS
ncbi:DUF7147 family protein [Bacillus sp. FJAT-44742]|uniref:DUF7147 family protein n=1 Tax=Bacillus sp. FJAT-44742 TaxID=2014005 RepID=UPI000C24FD59|nr:methylthioribose kinase [Bacillus sp. FJAT-44742]